MKNFDDSWRPKNQSYYSVGKENRGYKGEPRFTLHIKKEREGTAKSVSL